MTGFPTTINGREVTYESTSNVTSMQYMFFRCYELTSIPKFDTSKVTNMYEMFYSCSKLATVPEFDTSKVTNMTMMFGDCSSLPAIFPFTIDLQSVTSSSNLFGMFLRSSVTTVRFKNVPSSLLSDLTSSTLGTQLTSITVENTI